MKRLLLIICAILLTCLVSALPDDSITVNSPATGTWTTAINYTPGFSITVIDPEVNYSVECKLYIGITNNLAIIAANGSNAYAKKTITQNSASTFYMNHTLPYNSTLYYWAIGCVNNSHLPSRNTPLRILKHTYIVPDYTINGVSFTNNTWRKSGLLGFNVTGIDDTTQGESLTVKIINSSNNYVWATNTLTNGTSKNVTVSLADGNYTLQLNFSNPAGKYNASLEIYTLRIDSTAPVLSHNAPANNYISSLDWIFLNVSITERYLNGTTILLNWDGTDEVINVGNCSGTPPAWECTYNKTSISAAEDIVYFWKVNDTTGNLGQSSSRTVNVDIESPLIDQVTNLSISASTATYKILVSETVPSSCKGVLKDYGANSATLTGAITEGVGSSNCSGTFTGTSLTKDGRFNITWNVTDESGSSNYSTQYGVFGHLYSGWNLMTWTDYASTSQAICNKIQYCSQFSLYNNSGSAYVTYTASTPTINNATVIATGTAFLVYVSADDYLITNDKLPVAGEAGENITIYNNTWNTIGLTKKSNLWAVYSAYTFNDSSGVETHQNISWASWYNASAEQFATCQKGGSCTGTANNASQTTLPLGYAVWLITDQKSASHVINRSKVTG